MLTTPTEEWLLGNTYLDSACPVAVPIKIELGFLLSPSQYACAFRDHLSFPEELHAFSKQRLTLQFNCTPCAFTDKSIVNTLDSQGVFVLYTCLIKVYKLCFTSEVSLPNTF